MSRADVVRVAALALISLASTMAGAAASTVTPALAAVPKAAMDYDVSVGDSYAAGYQPVASATAHRDRHGFAYQVVDLARARGYRFILRNFACDGATTTTILQQVGCSLPAPGPDVVSYPTRTQAAAADRFIARHHGKVGLITVSIGGNDILGCTAAAIFISCMTQALPGIEANLHSLLAGLRQAAGAGVPIVGLTYPDVFLGLYTSKDPSEQSLALVSIAGFERLLNPAFETEYSDVGAAFVDVTKATGAYVPLTETTTSLSAPSGRIPVAVADICSLTYYCGLHDVHPTDRGYTVIARLIVATLPRRRCGPDNTKGSYGGSAAVSPAVSGPCPP
jgi:lysophospholipase L1-like esterase